MSPCYFFSSRVGSVGGTGGRNPLDSFRSKCICYTQVYVRVVIVGSTSTYTFRHTNVGGSGEAGKQDIWGARAASTRRSRTPLYRRGLGVSGEKALTTGNFPSYISLPALWRRCHVDQACNAYEAFVLRISLAPVWEKIFNLVPQI